MNCPFYVQIEFAFSLGVLNAKFCLLLRIDPSHVAFKTNEAIVKFKFNLGNESDVKFRTIPFFSKLQDGRLPID